jgi:hypothetical protein
MNKNVIGKVKTKELKCLVVGELRLLKSRLKILSIF